jgi:hypothetical protein
MKIQIPLFEKKKDFVNDTKYLICCEIQIVNFVCRKLVEIFAGPPHWYMGYLLASPFTLKNIQG